MLSAYPRRLPHVSIETGRLFFGGLEDTGAGEAEREFLALADGRTSFGDLLARHPHLLAAAAMTRYAVWLSSPLAPLPRPAAGQHGLILASHPGDAELSMGGFLLRHRGTDRFTQLVCFSRQLETRAPEAFPSRREVTAIRRDESHLAAAILGIETRYLDLPEYVMRHAPREAERLVLPPEEIEAAVRLALYDAIAELAPTHLYAPAAVGGHPDQRMIFDAVLELYEADYFPGLSVHLYENFPLSASYLHVDDFLSRFEGSYLEPVPWCEDSTGVLAEKLTLLEVFRSRLDLGHRQLLLEVSRRSARLERRAAAAAERFWTLREAALYG
jgi:LmbE family N-acetylglucosaminyl deacetylase